MIVIIIFIINVRHILNMVVKLKVILDLAGDCNNYSCIQCSPFFEYGSSSRTQRPHTYE